jgi:(p)ppGpp synthase/HD superfamily hydrolase
MIGKLIAFAAAKHEGQTDQSGRPYILHVMKVMHYLKSDDDELNMIAIGHDLVEDCKVTYQDLRELGCSERVIAGICAMTKVPGETEDECLGRIIINFDAIRVKLADLRHNSDIRRLKGIRPKDLERIAKYHRWYLILTAQYKRICLNEYTSD